MPSKRGASSWLSAVRPAKNRNGISFSTRPAARLRPQGSRGTSRSGGVSIGSASAAIRTSQPDGATRNARPRAKAACGVASSQDSTLAATRGRPDDGAPAGIVPLGAIHASASIARPSAIGIATKAETRVARVAETSPG